MVKALDYSSIIFSSCHWVSLRTTPEMNTAPCCSFSCVHRYYMVVFSYGRGEVFYNLRVWTRLLILAVLCVTGLRSSQVLLNYLLPLPWWARLTRGWNEKCSLLLPMDLGKVSGKTLSHALKVIFKDCSSPLPESWGDLSCEYLVGSLDIKALKV